MQPKGQTEKNPVRALIRLAKERKGAYGLYAILLAAALLCIFLGSRKSVSAATAPKSAEPSEPAESQTVSLERRLSAILSQMRGAGRVEVLITYETTGELVPAMSSRTTEDVHDSISGKESATQRSVSEVTEPATVKTGEGQTPIVLMRKEPKVLGVVIVAEGAADQTVRLRLQRAAQAATGVPLSQIEVFEMKTHAYDTND